MFIIEWDKSPHNSFNDPALTGLITQMEVLEQDASEKGRAVDWSDALCDLSRKVFFRVHRGTREQLENLGLVFQRIAGAIEGAALDENDPIRQRASHIRGRGELLIAHAQ